MDSTDEINSKLLFFSLQKRANILIVLPDNEPQRGVAMFATALLMSAVELINRKDTDHTVLYYGTSASFKKSMSETTINGVYLDSVFNSTYISGTARKRQTGSDDSSTYLPSVICVYHPVRPEHFAHIYQPDWIAVDCGREIQIDWLDDLLKYCKNKSLPIIAWSQNSFSRAIVDFEKYGSYVFYSTAEEANKSRNEIFKLTALEKHIVVPITFESEAVDIGDDIFKRVKLILLNSKPKSGMRIEVDAFKVVWRYLKTLERLAIPLKIYNQEARAFWKTYSLIEIKSSVERYISLIGEISSSISNELNHCFELLNSLYSEYESQDPPYWTALSSYCMDRPEDGTLRVIVFSSRSQKQLFSYTLLARFNISEEELLTDSKMILRSVSWFTNINDEDKATLREFKIISPIFVGLPDSYNISNFYHCVNNFQTSVILYPHQFGALKSILGRFNGMRENQLKTSVKTLKGLTGVCDEQPIDGNSIRYVLSKQSKILKILPNKNVKAFESDRDHSIDIGDLHTELARLFENSVEEDDSGELISININKETKPGNGNSESLILDKAIKITLGEGYFLLMDSNDQVNIIKGKEIVKVFCRALKGGDVLLCIQNQVKKDLFDLLVERINDHDSLSVHLSLLQKWREEFYLSYLIWRKDSPEKSLQEFWRQLKASGSDVESPMTISNWLRGYTLRPQDTGNIKRVGQILKNSYIIEHHSEIANAASRIVGLHISLSTKLKKWLEGDVYDLRGADMILVDKELNLTLGELRSSLKMVKIVKLEDFADPVLRSSIGILMKS